MTETGELAARRREQQVKWMWSMLEERLHARLRSDPALKDEVAGDRESRRRRHAFADARGRGDRGCARNLA